MDTNQRLQIVEACRDLATRLTYHSDHEEFDKAVTFYHVEGVWVRNGVPLTTHAAIRAAMSDRKPGTLLRHLLTNIMIDVLDQNSAKGVIYYLAYRHRAESESALAPRPMHLPFSMGEMHDEYVRTQAGWKLMHRKVKRCFLDEHPL